MQLLTFGHGTATLEELAALIRDAGIELVVDVRTIPRSRRHPHFWAERMREWVPQRAGAAYEWARELGGFRSAKGPSNNPALRHKSFRAYADYMETPQFDAALDAVLARAAGHHAAIMCSESLWWRCHRRLIADAATLLHETQVEHLAHTGKLSPHVLTDGVRVVDGLLRYDVQTSAAQ